MGKYKEIADLASKILELTKESEEFGQGWGAFLLFADKAEMPQSQKLGMIAQAILESARGTSDKAVNANNFLGLKYRDELSSVATPYMTGASDHKDLQAYCKFKSPADCIRGYQLFIERSPYKGWEEHLKTPLDYISFLKKCGYAEDPDYISKIGKLIPEAYGLLGIPLKDIERPDTHPEIDEDENDKGFTTPIFVKVKGVNYKEYKYATKSKKAEGLVVHYTVSGRASSSAVGVLKYLANNGLGCMVMDEDGVIYMPESFDIFNDAAAHAGKSSWNGYTGLNDEFMGMEICNWGRSSSEDKAYGRTRFSEANENIIKGWYQPYTEKQEKSLINFCRWAKSKEPAFKFENVCGHDEARADYGLKGDKQDPGASLSMVMPKLRKLLGV